jgi:hypothetical protein
MIVTGTSIKGGGVKQELWTQIYVTVGDGHNNVV